MNTTASSQQPLTALGPFLVPPAHATLLRRFALNVGQRLLTWAARPVRNSDRESIRQRYDSRVARLTRERQWQSEALRNSPLR
jgi:hypothetical protein